MASYGLQMTSDTIMMFKKKFLRSGLIFYLITVKKLLFWPIFMFWPQNGL